ncbi:cobaltochelatase subunit CobN [Limnoglobus roseus]|uniref:Cobaltochelatase n=1 Tax=Limnoglobus roseus TaxID=2598579 RepID=A0A5C1AKK1_9BACT|nr:cobaltochelatase subunit CobN [Limnoglobus roseus]QEL18242.1 cobaltochelatase [Limnoglobus roseus]
MSGKPSKERIVRTDGKPIFMQPKRGHLLICARGCCCGHTERNIPAVPIDFIKEEYKRRKIRDRVQLTMAGCLGPCPLANVALLFFDGKPMWFQAIDRPSQYVMLYDYIDKMLDADKLLPPPLELADRLFNYYAWANCQGGDVSAEVRAIVEGTAAGLLLLTHADTDVLTVQRSLAELPPGFPPVRAASLNRLRREEDLVEVVVNRGKVPQVVIVRLHGSLRSLPGVDRLRELVRESGGHLLFVNGVGVPDPELEAASTAPPALLMETMAYLLAGGRSNLSHMARFLSDTLLLSGHGYDRPTEQPQHGIYHPDLAPDATLADWLAHRDPTRPAVAILFYRAHWMSGNLDFVDTFVDVLDELGVDALPVFTSSLKDQVAGKPAAFNLLCDSSGPVIDSVICTQSFSLGDGRDGPEALKWLDRPILQAIIAGTSFDQWDASPRGLGPLDTAMNVALPELDGRIITVPISFKETVSPDGPPSRRALPTVDAIPEGDVPGQVIRYVGERGRIELVGRLAARFATLRRKPNPEKRIAFILTNSAGKANRVGNAVGLDAPASLFEIFDAMAEARYAVENPFATSDELIHTLIDRGCYDETYLTPDQVADAAVRVPVETYLRWYAELPESRRKLMEAKWGPPPGTAYLHDGHLCLAGLELGNALVALQPPRGYGMDPQAIYHRPDLPPPHYYYALYRWLKDVWGADAIVHVGKHGSVEWLPGKGVGLSHECFPEAMLGDLPLFYPFILSDPGEGMQAKRRSRAVIIDHLIPAMTTADSYGELDQLMQLVDEYYQVEMLDPSKLPLLQQQIWDLIRRANLDEDLKQVFKQDHGDHKHEWDEGVTADGTPLSLANLQGREFAHVVEDLDGYLCELAGAQIRDGLHTFGRPPEGEQLVDLVQSLVRLPNLDTPSLRGVLAEAFGLSLDELLTNRGKRFDAPPDLSARAGRVLFTHADALQSLDELGKHLLDSLRHEEYTLAAIAPLLRRELPDGPAVARVAAVLTHVCQRLVPIVGESTDEVTNLLRGLDGRYVPAGPSGAPTRGMAHILPTGRNFYALDPRALPSPGAWRVGQELAREAAERHRRETGEWPETVGLSVWGTSAMRTQGDDVAQVFALLGIRPVWHEQNRRLTGFAVIPLAELGRPRIDVVVRISGFFRDAFPHVVRVLDEAVAAVARLDEPPEMNFLRKHFLADLENTTADCSAQTERQALYRVFSSPPGCYGAGILPLIDEKNWSSDADLATAYVNWGGYAYTGDDVGIDARDTFRHRLAGVQVALHNQDNREHDIFDSDDYLQFHGGMIATIRALTGKQPRHYFGDTQDPARPAVRDLKEEAHRVFRSRVVNPKWIEGIKRHGYKGGLELAATVDYLFGFDATAEVIDDWMYERLAQAYALDSDTQNFLAASNPWALKAIADRLLEAAHRGLWENPNPETLAAIQAVHRAGDDLLEARTEAASS